ncbi:Copper amine oxidase 1 [Lasiodiplodia theobromae]|uniref:Amine oxidase n=1 Tax=Lasiodiplodia theobromae TaxID=45133 RepID=A0A5N5D0H3_9PEZI|nr:Copper amine oxidase 1 [Lasiodiplodia theobromae]
MAANLASAGPGPFDPVAPNEIQLASSILSAAIPGVPLRYKRVSLHEPVKRDVIPYIEAQRLGQQLPAPPERVLQILFHRKDTGAFCKALLKVRSRQLIYVKELPKNVQAPIDGDELAEMERVCLGHPVVKAEIEKMELPLGVTVCCDPWMYGTDSLDEHRRLFQCYLYVVEINDPLNNHYSTPCTFSPVFDSASHELVRMDFLPTGIDGRVKPTSKWKPVRTVQYAHHLLDQPLRSDLKPYIVQQPEGPSYSIEGNVIRWQKWRFVVGFNDREGLVIYNITYDGRNVFYRLSVSEMTVPYGDPRRPYHRKQAFDIGDVGFGASANELALGCDCLGHISYFDAYRVDPEGSPVKMSNVVCVHEQDAGLQHKHTNWRDGSTATVVRNRQLVVQMICTLANYEYIFAYMFDQAAGIELEVRATGILSTTPFENEDAANGTVPWATNVGPGVSAPFHQHMFSFRVDPAVDGFENTVFFEESVSLPPGEENPYGAGYVTEDTVIQKSSAVDTSVDRHRVFKIRNDSVLNPITHKPVAYKLNAAPSQMLIMGKDSFNVKRAQYATKPIWVTKYQEDELFAAGEFTNQSKGEDGIQNWVARGDDVEKADLVLWHSKSNANLLNDGPVS